MWDCPQSARVLILRPLSILLKTLFIILNSYQSPQICPAENVFSMLKFSLTVHVLGCTVFLSVIHLPTYSSMYTS